MTARDVLESLGVCVVEVDDLSVAACWVSEVNVLLVRPDAHEGSWNKAMDLVMGVKR